MGNDEPQKSRQTHSVSFSRINGRDENGKDILGQRREIGSVWSRPGREGESILRLDHTPQERGVFFVREMRPPSSGDRTERKEPAEAQHSKQDIDRDR